MNPFIKLTRSQDIEDLCIHHPNAFVLLTIIALRATRRDNKITGLAKGQAWIGYTDMETRSIYRYAEKTLVELGFATIKATNKGTIATITNTDIYDINAEDDSQQNDHPTTIQRPSNDHPTTTNKEIKKERIEEIKKPPSTGPNLSFIDLEKIRLTNMEVSTDANSLISYWRAILSVMGIQINTESDNWNERSELAYAIKIIKTTIIAKDDLKRLIFDIAANTFLKSNCKNGYSLKKYRHTQTWIKTLYFILKDEYNACGKEAEEHLNEGRKEELLSTPPVLTSEEIAEKERKAKEDRDWVLNN